MVEAEICSGDFKRFLDTLRPMAHSGLATAGCLTISATEVELNWQGSGCTFERTDQAPESVTISVRIDEAALLGIATILPTTNTVKLGVDGSRLFVGNMCLPCRLVNVDDLTPIFIAKSALDLLLCPYIYDAETIERSGYSRQVAKNLSAIDETTDSVEEAFNQLGLDSRLLAVWIEAHLTAKANGELSFEFESACSDGPRQIELFTQDRTFSPTGADNFRRNSLSRFDSRDEALGFAADALEWLGIDYELLTDWVDAHFYAIAGGQTSFAIAAAIKLTTR